MLEHKLPNTHILFHVCVCGGWVVYRFNKNKYNGNIDNSIANIAGNSKRGKTKQKR